ncbi:MAG: RNA polymerase sigma factor [Muribaculaceae bacterium]
MEKEQTLAHKVAQGDAKAIRRLYDLTVGYMTSVCMRYVADTDAARDVLQESYVTVFQSIGSSFVYRGEGSLKAWMARIVMNKSIDYMRQEMRMGAVMMAGDDLPDVPDVDDADGIDAAAVPIDVIHKLITELPAGYRAVFNMCVIEGVSQATAAQQLGIKPVSVASQLLRAKALLARRIKEYLNNDEL